MSSNKNFGTTADALTNATRVKPPTAGTGGRNEVSLTSAAVSAFATGADSALSATAGPG